MATPRIELEREGHIGPLTIHYQERACITPDGKLHQLTVREMHVLCRLSFDQVASKQSIAAIVALQEFPESVDSDHPEDFLPENAIEIAITSLRHKLGIEIENRRFQGYILKP